MAVISTTVTKIGISIGALATILLLKATYSDALFSSSLDWIPKLQKDASTTEILFWANYSDFAVSLCLIGPILLSYLFSGQRSRCFYYLFVVSMCLSIDFKLLLHAPRPFWVAPEIRALDCSGSFGSPSMHSFNVICLSLTTFLDIFDWTSTSGAPPTAIKENSTCIRALSMLAIATLTSTLGFSRMFLGSHSLD